MNKEGSMNELDDELNFEDEDIDEDIDIPPLKTNIHSDKIDAEIESLYRRFKKGTLVLQPDYQRRSVWDIKKSSRLIESAILGIPLPQIYTSEEEDGKEYVIDGQQRLTAFFSFIDEKYKMNGLWSFPEINGKSFKELIDEQQEKIWRCTIHTIKFTKDSDPTLKFEIFKRLNTGVVSLNDQELRNCAYAGEYSKLLKELSENKEFMELLRLEEPHKRMKDVELILRFAAFYHNTYLNYRSPIKTFLNDDMRKFRHISENDNIELVTAFKNSISIIKSMFGNHAFKRFHGGNDKNKNGYWESKKFNASLYDIMMYSFAKEDKNKIYQNLDAIREALIDLMVNDKEFIESIQLSTSSRQAVIKRFDKWRIVLQEIIGIGQKDQRCFSLKLKEELYKNDPTCTICGQRIQDIDGAAIDHIEQYWKHGRTIPENARLTHRYCNLARPRNDLAPISTTKTVAEIKSITVHPIMKEDNDTAKYSELKSVIEEIKPVIEKIKPIVEVKIKPVIEKIKPIVEAKISEIDDGEDHPCTIRLLRICANGNCITRFRKGECYNIVYVKKALYSFSFNGQIYTKDRRGDKLDWIGMTITLSEIISIERKDIFNKLDIRGPEGRNFASNSRDRMVKPKRIDGTDIYVETNLSADHHVGLCRAILEACNYDYKNCFQVNMI